MNFSPRIRFLLIVLLTFATPAYANNPPQPDGLFSVLLVFPIAMIALRLAQVPREKRSVTSRIVRGIIVAGLILFLMVGTELGALATLCVLVYAAIRASQMMRDGRGTKRVALGSALILFALLACADYIFSIMGNVRSSASYEASAVGKLRALTSAEQDFAKSGHTDSNAPAAFADLKELEKTGSISPEFSGGRTVKGYQYFDFLSADKKHFVIYAIPATGLRPASGVSHFIPGSSLLYALFNTKERQNGTGFRSFECDETGVIRFAIRPNSAIPPARDEYTTWQPLQ